MIHNKFRYLLTLVALLAMTTGAWADEGTLLTTINASSDFTSGSKTFDNVATVTFEAEVSCTDYAGWYTNGSPISVTVAPVDGVTITSVKFFIGDNSPEDTQAPFTATLDIEYGMATKTQVNDTYYDGGLKKIEVYGTAAPAGPEVTITEKDTKASFEMPAYDATVSYELVRDMAQGVAFSGLPEGDGCILKKDGDKYTFATAPTIALEDNISGTAQAITAEGITLSYEKKGEGDTWVAQPDDFDIAIDAVPGTYRVVAKATTGLYDGTLYSPEFTLAEAYDLTLSPATDAHLQSVTVAGTAKTADENGVIRGIEPTKKVKITTTGPDYIIRKAAVKKTPKANE